MVRDNLTRGARISKALIDLKVTGPKAIGPKTTHLRTMARALTQKTQVNQHQASRSPRVMDALARLPPERIVLLPINQKCQAAQKIMWLAAALNLTHRKNRRAQERQFGLTMQVVITRRAAVRKGLLVEFAADRLKQAGLKLKGRLIRFAFTQNG